MHMHTHTDTRACTHTNALEHPPHTHTQMHLSIHTHTHTHTHAHPFLPSGITRSAYISTVPPALDSFPRGSAFLLTIMLSCCSDISTNLIKCLADKKKKKKNLRKSCYSIFNLNILYTEHICDLSYSDIKFKVYKAWPLVHELL